MSLAVSGAYRDFHPKYCCSATLSWAGHLVFAGLLMRELRPKLFVELGTHLGNSYFAFCQSVKESHLDSRCFAVDSWCGDEQAGVYSDDIYRFVSAYNQEHFSEFSTLLRGLFDEFTDRFEDGSIDLLHIDGFHSYEAVSHDFRRWISKVRPGGIVLFHDIAERQEGFGVWKFWEEVRRETEESFGFTHSSGLGVWRKPGGEALQSAFLRSLFACDLRVIHFISNTAWSPFENNPVGKTAPREEPVEFFTADRDGAWRRIKTEMTLVDAAPVHPHLETELCCGEKPSLRIDIGRPGHWVELEKLTVAAGPGKITDLLQPERFRGRNCFFEFVDGTDGAKLRVIPYTDDPQLYFTLPEQCAGRNCRLALEFSHASVKLEELVAAKIDSLSRDKERSALLCRSLKEEKNALLAVRDTLNSECDALRRNQEALTADRDALQRDQAALAADRDEAWQSVRNTQTEFQKFQSEAEKERQALIADRETIRRNWEQARQELEKVQRQILAVEERGRESLRKLIVRKNEVEQESCERLRRLELLRELYSSLLQILWQREQVLREQAAVREKLWQALGRMIVRRNEAENGRRAAAERRTLAALREARRVRGQAEAAARRYQESLREETYALRDAAVCSAMRNWERVLRRLTLLKPFFHGVALLSSRHRGIYERWLVRRSALFDPVWYRARYPESAGRDAVRDYLETGRREGRDPSPWFSSRDYLEAHPEVDGDPLVHFLTRGWQQFGLVLPRPAFEPEDRGVLAASPLWDEAWYREQYPDLVHCADLLKHYLTQGWREGRDPSPWFDTDFYRRNNPDVAGNPLVHYLVYGQFEGRAPQETNWPEIGLEVTAAGLFRPDWYRKRHSEVGAADPWRHFVTAGCAAGFDPSPEFSLALYRELNPDIGMDNPLIHYWLYGRVEKRRYRSRFDSDRELVAESGFFDAAWYLENNSDVARSGMDPLTHFLTDGYAENRDPSALFSCAGYRVANPDLPAAENPLLHYLRTGAAEGCQAEVPMAELRSAEYLLARRSGMFDEEWYRAHNPDLEGRGLDLEAHFLNSGWREGRDPSGRFSVRDYHNFNPDIKAAGISPLVHFLFSGVVEDRRYRPAIGEADECRTLRQLDVAPELYDGNAAVDAMALPEDRTVAVHLHLYYTEMAEYFAGYLKRVPRQFDLFLSLPTSEDTAHWEEYFRREVPQIRAVEAVHTPNRGRDIAPLIVTFGRKLMQYDVIAHIHSKRSPHAAKQLSGWLDYIMEHLFGSAEEIGHIFSLLARNDRMVFPPAYSQLDHDDSGWGRNGELIRECIRRYPALDLKTLPRYIEFSHGSMFWARGAAMAGFLDLPFTYEDFPEEPVASDATLAHVLERLTLLATARAGGRASMLFRKDDPEDQVRWSMMREKLERFQALYAAPEMSEKKLILVSHDSDNSGAPLLALGLARALKDLGYTLYIVILKRGELFEKFEACGMVQAADLNELHKLQSTLPVLREAGFRNALLNTALSGALAPAFREAGIEVVTLVHEMGYSISGYQWEKYAHQTIAGSGKVVMPSSVVAKSWADIGLEVPADKLVINPQGNYCRRKDPEPLDKKLARQQVCKELGLPEDARIVLAAALAEKRKGFEAFVETAGLFRSRRSVYFVWLGADEEHLNSLGEAAAGARALDHCILRGFQPGLERFMAAADVFFLPSLADPFPTVALLAAAEATPLVLCDGCTGSADFCRDFEAGVITEYSAENFAAEIARFLDDDALRERVGAQALAFSNSFHSLRQYVIELLSYYPDGLRKVSCVVPNYQYEKYLPERLDSILKQDYPIYDIVFLDDCSTDRSLAVAEKILSEQEIDYTILPNEKNSGSVFRQWFKGIAAAGGELVWIAEADDSCAPDFLRKTVPAFADPKVHLSYAQSCLMDGDGKVYNANFKTHTDAISAVKWMHRYSAPFDFELNDGLAVKNTIPNASAIVIRKAATEQIDRNLLFQFKVAGDWVFYLELLKGGRVAFTPEVLNYYRRHRASVVNRNMTRNLQEIEMIHRYLLEHFALSDRTILAMEEDFRRNCSGFAHDFKPTLDHRSFLHAKKHDVLAVFASDDLHEVPARLPELRKLAETCEIWLMDAGEHSPDAAVLEQLPSDFGFLRLADFLEDGRPEVGRMVMVAECRSEKAFRRVEPLKFLLREEDALLVIDAAGSLSEMPGMARSRKGFQEEFEACLNGTRKESGRGAMLCFPLADNGKGAMR